MKRAHRGLALATWIRGLPIVVLLTVVAVAVTSRVVRSRATHHDARASATELASYSQADASPFDRPLRESSPPPSARVVRGGARTIHGDGARTHRASGHGPRFAKTKFQVDVGGPVAAQVTVSPDEKTLYAATLDGSLVALASDDGGKARWTVPLRDRIYSAPLVHDDGTIYVGTDGKKLVAISPTGTVFWKLEVDGEVDSGPALVDGKIVFAAGANVYAARRGGDIAWRYRTKGKVFTAPAITPEGRIVFGSQDDHVTALDSRGALVWSVDLGADVDGACAIADDGSIVAGTDKGEVVRLSKDGAIVSRTAVGGYVRGPLSVARNGDALVGTYGPVPRLVRVRPDGAIAGAMAIQGTGSLEFGIHGGPLEDDEGTLFFGAQDDMVRAVRADGTLAWAFETTGDVDAPLTLLSDGSLVVGSEDGTVTMLLP